MSAVVRKSVASSKGKLNFFLLLFLGVIFVGLAVAGEMQQPDLPEFASLEKATGTLTALEKQPLRIDVTASNRYQSATTHSSGGYWDILLVIDGEQRWFAVGAWFGIGDASIALDEVLAPLSYRTPIAPVTAWHDGARIWQLERPEGAVFTYPARVAEVQKERTKRHKISALMGGAGLLLLVVARVLLHRARAAQSSLSAS